MQVLVLNQLHPLPKARLPQHLVLVLEVQQEQVPQELLEQIHLEEEWEWEWEEDPLEGCLCFLEWQQEEACQEWEVWEE